jgi:hypothetical protein
MEMKTRAQGIGDELQLARTPNHEETLMETTQKETKTKTLWLNF